MTKRLALLSVSLLAAHAAEEHPAESPLIFLDAHRASVYGNFGMEFDNSPGELDAYQLEAHSILSNPIALGGGVSLLPTFRYEGTFLRYDGIPGLFPVGDEDLHSVELPLYLIRNTQGSRWLFGAWLQPSLSSDFDDIDSDDIFVDLALGAAYKFSDRLYVGAGAAAFDVFGNASLIPGFGFIWSPTDDIRVQLTGPAFTATWQASQDWRFGVDIRSAGGLWNIDDNNVSRTLDFTSIRAGLHAQRRICDTWWLEGGAGISFANEIELRTPDGLGLNEAVLGDLDEGIYGYFAVKKEVW